MAETNMETAIARGISKGIREGIGSAVWDTAIAIGTVAVLGLAVWVKVNPDSFNLGGNGEIALDPITVHIGEHFLDDSPSGSYDYVLERDGSTAVPIPSPCDGTIGHVWFQGRTGNLSTGFGAGQVVEVACESGGGGKLWLFGHLVENSQTKKPGDRIAKGEAIGIQGQTGRASGVHIHNQIHEYSIDGDGIPVRGERITDRDFTKPLIMAYIEFLRKGQKGRSPFSSTGFGAAYQWALSWEGGCVNHPADRGGKTYKGVTEANAARFGYSDPCSMPDSAVEKVYQSFWNDANCQQWRSREMAIVCLDTAINFGTGGWQMFVQSGTRRDGYRYPPLPKNEQDAARTIAQWRLEYRDFRVAEAPDQRVFLRGWQNRDRALLDAVR